MNHEPWDKIKNHEKTWNKKNIKIKARERAVE